MIAPMIAIPPDETTPVCAVQHGEILSQATHGIPAVSVDALAEAREPRALACYRARALCDFGRQLDGLGVHLSGSDATLALLGRAERLLVAADGLRAA